MFSMLQVSCIYRNGDNHFAGRTFTWNKHQIRTFDSLLSEITNSVKLRNGAVRRLYTPVHGHRVKDMSVLEEGATYVAASQEAFKKLEYARIDAQQRRPNKTTKSLDYIVPVYHSKRQVSGRVKKLRVTGKIIKCWPNGDDIFEPHTIVVRDREQTSMLTVCGVVTQALQVSIVGAIHKLYTRDGELISNPSQLENNGHYVGVGRHEPFKHVDYKDRSKKNFATSPKLERRVLPPIRRSNNNSLQSSPDHSYASHPGSENSYTQRHRRNLQRQQDDQYVYAKPRAHKRSSEKKKEVDYDQDQGGVFKARGENRATKGAREVKDSRQTRTDLPIDQQVAQEVKDEETPRYEDNGRRSETPPPYQQEDIKGANSKNKNKNKGKETANTPPQAQQGRAQRAQRESFNQPGPNARRNSQGATKAKTNSVTNSNNSHSNSTSTYDNKAPVTNAQKHDAKEAEERKKEKEKEEEAATKIQAQYRGFQTRKELSAKQRTTQESNKPASRADTPRADTPRADTPRADTPKNQMNEKKQMSDEEAATKIQATYRGHAARKELKNTPTQSTPVASQNEPQEKTEAEKETEAATKIQATFRGHKARKDLNAKEVEANQEAERIEDQVQDDIDDLAKQAEAATKIQANYRGYTTRKQLQEERSVQNA